VPVASGEGGGQVDFAVRVGRLPGAGVSQIDNSVGIGEDGAGGSDPNPGDNVNTDTTLARAGRLCSGPSWPESYPCSFYLPVLY
jgi:hypothetical protein